MQGNKNSSTPNKFPLTKNQMGSSKKYQAKNINGDRTTIRFKTTFFNTVADVLKSRGWQEAKEDMDWDIWWCDIAGVKELFDNYFIEEGRKICHFRNHYELTRKNLMVKNLKRLRKHFEKSHNKREAARCDIYPTTYELPNEYHIFVEEFRKNPGSIWIMKPAGKSQGKGIFLFQKLKDITEWKKKHGERLQAFSQDPHAPPVAPEQPEPYVVQRYIVNPYLIGGRKFDLRVYVLITSFHPLVAWLHREGFARFSNTRFSLDSIENIHVHLTNVAIQKTAQDYDPERGCKWAMWKVRRYLMAKHGNALVKNLIDEMNNIFIKSLQSVQKVIISDKHCFELYGYDILIDANLKPWLLEVNAAPSLTASSSEDYALKFSLINDVLDVIDLENKRLGHEKRIGGFDLLWNDGPVLSTPVCPQCNSNSRPPVSSAFLGCANERKETPVNLIPPTLAKEMKPPTSVNPGE